MSPTVKSILFGGKGAGSASADLGLAILRLGTGFYLCFAHGMAKLVHDGHLGPAQQVIDMTAKLGFPAPTLFAWCSVLAESVVAFIFAIGLFTRPAAVTLIFNMCVAAFVAHLHAPWTSSSGPSKEMAILYLLPFITILFTGPGHFSADAMIRTAGKE